MATIKTSREADTNPHNRNELVRDLYGKRVRMTYYRRDPCYAIMTGIAEGKQGPFDMDEIVEGQLTPVAALPPLNNHLWGIRTDTGEIKFAWLAPTAPTELGENSGMVSQWDGKRNGTYKIEAI